MSGPHFSLPLTVRFQHCDPAGIVFFPRYYEMANLAVERFFEEVVGRSFHQLHLVERTSVPTVAIETEFAAVSRLEDRLTLDLAVERFGRSSVTVSIRCRGADDEMRFRSTHTLVAVDMETTTSRPWPDAVAARFASLVAPSQSPTSQSRTPESSA